MTRERTHYEHVRRPVSALIEYARNARVHSEAHVGQLAAAIREFGFTNPILIDEHDNIIAGHGRVLAARKLKMPDVPCVVVTGLTDTQRRALVISDNKLALNSAWDNDMLVMELGDLNSDNFDLNLVGFDDKELERLLTPGEAPSRAAPDEFAAFGEDIATEHRCPSCGYQWSGKSA